MSRKTKKNKVIDKNQPSSNGVWNIVLFVIIAVCFAYGVDYMYANMGTAQISAIRPAEINWDNGLPLLLAYGVLIAVFVCSGYFMAKKIDCKFGFERC